MSDDSIFVVQIVMVKEDQWFLDRGEPPVRSERSYYLVEHLFAARDAEAAYQSAEQWIARGCLNDSNNDLPGGGTTKYFPLGIHQLEEVALVRDIAKLVYEPYGLDLPGVWLPDVDEHGVLLVRPKDQLEAFNPHRWLPRPR